MMRRFCSPQVAFGRALAAFGRGPVEAAHNPKESGVATLASTINIIEKIKSADIGVFPQRCVTVRNRNASCRRCAEACTSGAISLEDNNLVIDPDKCIGCGTCATRCPTCALEARRPNDMELQRAVMTAARANNNVAVIACREIVMAAEGLVDTAKVVGVECLGRVDESLISALAAAGVSKVVLVQGNCPRCDHAVGLTTAQEVAATANALMKAWGCPMETVLSQRFPKSCRSVQAKGYDESRRNFFFRAKDDAVDMARIAATEAVREELHMSEPEQPRYIKVMDDGTLPHFLPDRRERLLDNLAQLGDPAPGLIETRLWGHVIIDVDLCQSCQMCATFCPTGAIMKFEEGDQMGIDHFPGDCVKCRCCQDVCAHDALTISDEVFAEDLLTGAVERITMRGRDPHRFGSKKTQNTMRDVLGCDDIFDR